MKTFTTKKLAMMAVMTALVCALSWVQIPLGGDARLHLGNVMCLLAGIILGPIPGGLAAGLGSALFDLSGNYIMYAPTTLIFKFLMAFVCGKIAWSKNREGKSSAINIFAGVLGIVTYIILYLSNNLVMDIFFKKLEMELVWAGFYLKGVSSLINGVIAVAASVPLAVAINKALQKAKIEK